MATKEWKQQLQMGKRPQQSVNTEWQLQVVKDHNNHSIQDIIDVSNMYCYRNASVSSSEVESEDEEFHPKHFPTVPCCFVIVNHGGFLEAFDNAMKKLEFEGLVVETTLDAKSDTLASGASSNEVISTICKIERVMELCKHALYHGDIDARLNRAQLTCVKLMDVSSYLNKFLAKDFSALWKASCTIQHARLCNRYISISI
ncbi:Hypothetical predicted protein [Paramuricea clavata]|uniref:Uncharacterized protein n=1 Tax=Paramuricea clavata TaxID=317549 RepID=A0A7D9IC12_PARCT|nr:Hypothetical predicted protein [Paramuricea clavata]